MSRVTPTRNLSGAKAGDSGTHSLLVEPDVDRVREQPEAPCEQRSSLLDRPADHPDRLPCSRAGLEDAIDGSTESAAVEVAWDAERRAEVEMSDPEDVDA